MGFMRIISIIFRIPLHIFLWGSLSASLYAAYSKVQGITWGTPIFLGIIMVLWYIGLAIKNRADEEDQIG